MRMTARCVTKADDFDYTSLETPPKRVVFFIKRLHKICGFSIIYIWQK